MRSKARSMGQGAVVAILHGAVAADAGPDEQDVLVEIDTVSRLLTGLGYAPVALPLTLDLAAARRRLARIEPAFVFNLVESIDGKGRLIPLAPTLLDALGIPYTGSGSEAVFLTSNKLIAKRLLRSAGIDTPDWIEAAGALAPLAFRGPSIVKSVWEHASIGIDDSSVVADGGDIAAVVRTRRRRLGGEWFAESYVDGREFNLGLLAGEDGVEVLPPAEMLFVDYPAGKPRIVDYAAKWLANSFEYNNTVRRFDFAASERPLIDRLIGLARACWQLFGLRGYARVDFRIDAGGRPWVLEVNINPCLSPDAGFAAALARAGLDIADAVRRIVGDMPDRADAAAGPGWSGADAPADERSLVAK